MIYHTDDRILSISIDTRPGKLPHNYYITMENHHFQWVNPLFRLGHFQVGRLLNYQAGYFVFLPLSQSYWSWELRSWGVVLLENPPYSVR